MALGDHAYSRLVSWAKIGLPLLALGLLSTLFLFSRTVSQSPDLPFSEGDLRDRVRDQVLTEPYYAGTTEDGATISLKAARARPDAGRAGRAVAEDVEAQIRSSRGDLIHISAAEAILDDRLNAAELMGSVVLRTSSGYRVETGGLVSALHELRAESRGPVTAFGPPGTLDAGRLVVTSGEVGGALLLFTQGVKLVYDPAREE